MLIQTMSNLPILLTTNYLEQARIVSWEVAATSRQGMLCHVQELKQVSIVSNNVRVGGWIVIRLVQTRHNISTIRRNGKITC